MSMEIVQKWLVQCLKVKLCPLKLYKKNINQVDVNIVGQNSNLTNCLNWTNCYLTTGIWFQTKGAVKKSSLKTTWMVVWIVYVAWRCFFVLAPFILTKIPKTWFIHNERPWIYRLMAGTSFNSFEQFLTCFFFQFYLRLQSFVETFCSGTRLH